MDDSQIFRGVRDGDQDFLFTSHIEQDLAEIKRETERLEGEIEKYERLIKTLDLLPRELSWSVPHIALTKHALLPNAELINTNEVTVHIGDNWFVKCSAHHAKGICNRRQERCRETISALQHREKLLRSYQKVVCSKGGIAGGRESVSSDEEEDPLKEAFAGQDIQEFVTEEQYLLDKEIHRKNVMEHYRKKKEQREKEQTATDDVMKRLEELELEEEMSGELRTMERSERSAAPAREIPAAKKKKKGGVKFAEEEAEPKEEEEEEKQQERTVKLGWTWDDGDSSASSTDEDNSSIDSAQIKTEAASSSPQRRLSFAQHLETGSDETAVIEFCHTPVDPLPSVAPASSKTAVAELKSPSDIYANFQEMFAAAATPKSILKQPTKEVDSSEQWPTLSYPFSYIQGDLPSSDSDYEQETTESEPAELPPVIGDIVEKIVPSAPKVEEKKEAPPIKTKPAIKKVGFASDDEPAEAAAAPSAKPTKKMSRFKSSRMKK